MPTPTTTENTRRSYPHGEEDFITQLPALMQAAFALVQNSADWKAPIDALVPWELANVCMQSIEFMTATRAQCSRVTGPNGEDLAHLRAIGYRAGPAN
jgi:malate synthase